MKKIILFFAAFAALVSCAKENFSDVSAQPEMQTITFEAVAATASDEAETKTTLVDHSLVHWSKGDQVKVGFFSNNNPGQNTVNNLNGIFTAKIEEDSGSSSSFSTDTWSWDCGNSETASMYRDDGIAVYPASATVYSKRTIKYGDADTEVSYDLPSEQTAVANSFQSGVNFSYAHVSKDDFANSAASLSFINACALLKITLPESATDIAQVEISSRNGVALSGKFEIPYDKEGSYHDTPWSKKNSDGTLTFSAVSGNSVVTLSADQGKTLQAGGSYYVVVWPGTHNSGLSFEFKNAQGLSCTKEVDKAVSFGRARVEKFNFVSNIEFVADPELEVSATSLNLTAQAGTSSFTVLCNNTWTATSNQSWLTLSPTTGSGSVSDQTVTVTTTENNSVNDRTATITVTDETGTLTKTITVTQKAPSISVSMYYSGVLTTDTWNAVTVVSDVAWKISADQSWVTLGSASGKPTSLENVSVNFDLNPTASPRSVTFTVSNLSGTIVKTVTMTQPAGNPDTYKISGSYLTYASDLTDGLYVIANKYSSSYFWTESNGKLSMSYHSTSDTFSAEHVFEYKKDNAKTASAESNKFDTYYSWSVGTWKSLSTGKYLDENFSLNAESANAVNLVSANNWGDKGYGNGGGELQGYDIYHSKTTSNSKFTLWYNSNNGFAFGDMNLYWDGNSSSANKRKYYVYKVVKQ